MVISKSTINFNSIRDGSTDVLLDPVIRVRRVENAYEVHRGVFPVMAKAELGWRRLAK